MKTFQQFQEETPKVLPNIEKSMERTAKGIGKVINPADVKNFVINTVKNKALEKLGAKDDEEAINKVKGFVDDKVTKMTDELPGAVNKFSDFLKSGKIEQGFSNLNTQMQKGMKKPKK
tara:strand:+ start:349 stop:702 length:354 start_codon:yes stop_codon:yes gene_type:complete